MKVLRIYAALVTLMLFMIACGTKGPQNGGNNGGGDHNPPPVTKPEPLKYGAASVFPGNGTTSMKLNKTTQVGFDFSLVPKAYAQTTSTVVMTGTFNGFCAGLPSNDSLQTTGYDTKDYSVVAYGAGQLEYSHCDGSNSQNSWSLFWYDSANRAAATAKGFYNIGDGSLQGLVIATDTEGGTNATSGVFTVWVDRNGVLTQTPLTCTLGQTKRCQDTTNTFSILDGDRVIVVGTFHPGDTFPGFSWYIGKQ